VLESPRGPSRRLRWGVALVAATALASSACSSGNTDSARTATTASAPVGSQGCAARSAALAGTTEKTFVHLGHERTYLLTIPEGYDGSTPAPVVLNLHGAKGTGAKVNATSQMPEKAGARGYIVVAPDAQQATVETGTQTIQGGVWNLAPSFAAPDDTSGTTSTMIESELGEDDDVAFLNALMDSIEDSYCVDPTREYAAGKSAGAGMTTWLSCQPDPRFAAVAPVAGVNMPKYCPGTDIPPMVTFHGDADVPMPYAGNTVVGIKLGVPDVDTRLNEIAAKGDCTDPTETTMGTDVIHRVWTCPGGGALELYKVLGGGHTWPGESPGEPQLGVVTHTIDATDVMLDFFETHQLTAAQQ
jgi:polyhydroxybutyrate depolymerase